MRQKIKLIIILMLAILLIVFFAAGGIDKLSKIKLGGSASEADNKSFSKVNIKKWQKRLPIEITSIYPNQAGLARLYGEIENKSDQELEAIKIIVLHGKKKQLGAVTVENVKPGQSQTFDIQTAVRTAEVEDITGKISAIRIKGKP